MGRFEQPSSSTGIDPRRWSWAAMSPTLASSEGTGWRGTLLRVWSGTTPVMDQPALDQHYVVMHLGGAKRVKRRGDGPEIACVVDEGSITLVPAGTANIWRTEGPIAFAHLYVPPGHLESVIDRDFDAEGRDASLLPQVGCRDAHLEPLLHRMLDEVRHGPQANALLLDCLYERLCHRLVVRYCSRRVASAHTAAVALAPYRLRRVLDYIDVSLSRDISLADLAAAASASQSHFSRAFQAAAGLSPYQYVLQQRMAYARVLLLTAEVGLDEIAARCGFHSRRQFSFMFQQITGVRPRRFREMMHVKVTQQ